MIAGSLTYNTELDTKGFQKGINDVTGKTKSAGSSIKNIIAGLGITKIISKAFSMITSNIDNAVARIDTLNNFPKVMRNLGIGADESKDAIKQLSDNLKGLPTTLNDGAMAVQRFTSKNGDVKKSVQLFTAVNNALLAGGASADIQATALEQLSQAYAKGKPDMMEWRSLQTAMPAQLKQVAQAMGYVSTEQLGEELRKGTVSMDDFMDAIEKLNKEGTGEFLSFEKQAKNATGGIATSIKNMKTAVIRGVANIIQSLDESLQNAGFGGISGLIVKIGETLETALNKVADFIKKIDWKKVVETIKTILPVLGALVAGFVAMEVAEKVSDFIEKTAQATNLLGKAIELIIAHPVVAVILAVIAALVILYQKCEEFRKAVNEMFETIKDAVMTVWEELKPSLEELWDALKDLWEALKPVAEFIVAVLIVAVKVLTEVLTALIPIITEIAKNVIQEVTRIIQDVTNVVNAIVNFFTKTIPETFNNFVTGVQNFVNSVIDWFKNLPYNIGVFIGQMIGHIIQFGIDAWNWVTKELPRIIEGIINWFKELPGRIWQWLQNTIARIGQWIIDMKNKAIEGAKNFADSFVDNIKNLPNKMLEIGRNILEGLWNGIKNAKDWLMNKVSEFARGILDGMKEALGIHSPSTLFRDRIGKFIPQGIAVGIKAETGKVMTALDEMNNKMMAKMNNAVNIETGKMNASANIRASSMFNNTIVLNASFDGTVEMDKKTTGQILAPEITKAIKVGGLV